MDIKPHNITLQIYAKSEEEAERGRKAVIQFINIMKENHAAVTGDKIVTAVGKLSSSPFVFNEILRFFKG
jgi:hypothetical protein